MVLKPAPEDILELYLGSPRGPGFRPEEANDVRFVEDDWENPTLGCWGLGWEVWLNGMEVTQFTYFQQVGGIDCKPITGEITYGLERLAMYIQGKESLFDLIWTDMEPPRSRSSLPPRGLRRLRSGRAPPRAAARSPTATSIHQNEVEQSAYNFEHSDVEFLLQAFAAHEKHQQAPDGRSSSRCRPTSSCSSAGHTFNLLDARGAISVTERAAYIGRIRNLARAVAQSYVDSRARLGFPMAPPEWSQSVIAQIEAKKSADQVRSSRKGDASSGAAA